MENDYMGTLAFVTALSMFGGLIDAIIRFRAEGRDMTPSQIVVKTFFDLLIAAFAGVLSFWMVEHFTGSREMTALMCATVSMTGYMGGKAINIATNVWEVAVRGQIK